ncbi:MAG TPA: hypothetical protein VMZ27_18365 [Candidatus Saccharimonadales bacterium]|nr:hypothetical protein [Candidatus Saccharimonadales bacterium]
MSLMQLLNASKSVLNIRDEPSRYRMSQRRLLPKFGPVSGREAENETAPPEAGRCEKMKDQLVKDTTNAGKREMFMKRWLKLANPFSRKADPAPAKAPVQSELHLDGVKPVRNDLHEADLMVVRRQASEKAPAPERVERPSEKSGAGLVENR